MARSRAHLGSSPVVDPCLASKEVVGNPTMHNSKVESHVLHVSGLKHTLVLWLYNSSSTQQQQAMKTVIGFGAVGAVVGLGYLALNALERKNSATYHEKKDELQERLRSVPQTEEGEQISANIGEGAQCLEKWANRSWIERAVMPPEIPSERPITEIEMQPLTTTTTARSPRRKLIFEQEEEGDKGEELMLEGEDEPAEPSSSVAEEIAESN